jgi:hypothetical protein
VTRLAPCAGSVSPFAHTVFAVRQGSFGEALGQYFHAYRLLPTEPLLALSIGIAFCNQVPSCAGSSAVCTAMQQATAPLYLRHQLGMLTQPTLSELMSQQGPEVLHSRPQGVLAAGDVAPG